jgi:hypothetical protein
LAWCRTCFRHGVILGDGLGTALGAGFGAELGVGSGVGFGVGLGAGCLLGLLLSLELGSVHLVLSTMAPSTIALFPRFH